MRKNAGWECADMARNGIPMQIHGHRKSDYGSEFALGLTKEICIDALKSKE